MEKKYHLLDDEQACGEYLISLAKKGQEERKEIFNDMKLESENRYWTFNEKYPIETLIEKVLLD